MYIYIFRAYFCDLVGGGGGGERLGYSRCRARSYLIYSSLSVNIRLRWFYSLS